MHFVIKTGRIAEKLEFRGITGDISAQDFVRLIGDKLAKTKYIFSCGIRHDIHEMHRSKSVDAAAAAAGKRPERSHYFIPICWLSDVVGRNVGCQWILRFWRVLRPMWLKNLQGDFKTGVVWCHDSDSRFYVIN